MVYADTENSLKILETIICHLFVSFITTLYNPLIRNGVAAVGDSNPLAPTNFPKVYSWKTGF
jgi:hypothetical protein